jgi:hypothetical protein
MGRGYLWVVGGTVELSQRLAVEVVLGILHQEVDALGISAPAGTVRQGGGEGDCKRARDRRAARDIPQAHNGVV